MIVSFDFYGNEISIYIYIPTHNHFPKVRCVGVLFSITAVWRPNKKGALTANETFIIILAARTHCCRKLYRVAKTTFVIT